MSGMVFQVGSESSMEDQKRINAEKKANFNMTKITKSEMLACKDPNQQISKS